ncbi:LON peptidase substrate-binding domain-containing protein [Prauserella rugosa]|uniref:LON peptidase substrate-binding domain-containing protein n=1 Tax=Prauserella rugosa TaxID=43354 RepID=UPI0004C41DC0|nr:LON peptidase substrate-binding domain-containing protein [Prauserella rugosa]KMS88184.1 peptidase [Streptomyces regensis]
MADTRPGTQRETLPLFPLQTVLLPGTPMPLHIFEPRYRQLTVDLITGTVPHRLFGIVAMRTPLVQEVDELDHVHTIGCAARLREAKRLPDGRYDLVASGTRRFLLHDVDATAAPYLMGTVTWLDDLPVPADAEDASWRLADLARAAHRRYCDVAWPDDGWRAPAADTDPVELAYRLAADCVLPLHDQQALLEERLPLRRLRTVCRLLNRESGFLSRLRAIPASLSEMDDGDGSATKPSLN